ncbi:hypothetical protein GM418_10830 [Maribellus comscasis]|uniref:Uncharacterized protein n=1 Tax=Maribellus comscasis TaxID=2681766 RepID=A0A6I6K2J3_9BACT|nr:hypothetical protein [Maribellus comscasis]QGY44134.1 hypothetical protein GM418_10830 [Maribellus comscasis]
MENQTFEFTIMANGQPHKIKIDGHIMKIGPSKIDLRGLYRIFEKANGSKYAIALNDQNICVSQLMAAVINGETDAKDIAPAVPYVFLLHQLAEDLKTLEIK